jgi:hypothetical protein
LGISWDNFNEMMVVFGSMLPTDHILPHNMYTENPSFT